MPTVIQSFLDDATSTFTHVVFDHPGGTAAIVDPVLDYDEASGATSTVSADRVLGFVRARGLRVAWILETHAHADHLSAGAHLREATGAALAIGRGIAGVQTHFGDEFDLADRQGRQFDHLFEDGETFTVGTLPARVIATPGHTPDSVTYLIGDAAFIGDTLFAPHTGSARCDFPGGDAATLHDSIQRLLALPAGTRLFLCHDYPKDRAPRAEWSLPEQRGNVHLQGDAAAYIKLRRARDATLPPPRLLGPALRWNLRGRG